MKVLGLAIAATALLVAAPAHAEQPPAFQITLDADAPGAVLEERVSMEDWARRKNEYLPRRRWVAAYRWETVCVAPCTAIVPQGTTFRVAGARVTPSSDFIPDWTGGVLALHADTGSRRANDAGLLVGAVGLAATFAGIVLVLSGDDDLRTPGWIVGGAGIGMLAVGAILFATSGTSLTDDQHRRLAFAF